LVDDNYDILTSAGWPGMLRGVPGGDGGRGPGAAGLPGWLGFCGFTDTLANGKL